jgi:hypothetical protein
MRRSSPWIVFVLLALPLCFSSAAFAAEELYQAKGERVVGHLTDGTASLTGQAFLSKGDYEVFADQINWQPTTNELIASGKVKLLHDGAVLLGDSLTLNLAENTGELHPANGELRGFFLTSDNLTLFPDRLIALHSEITTCDRERPHYAFRASKVTVLVSRKDGVATPEKLQLRGGRLQFHGHSILPFPPFQINLSHPGGPSRDTLPIPFPGYSSADGFFVGYRWETNWQDDKMKLAIDWRTTARRGMRAASYFDYSLGSSDFLRLTLSRREDLRDEYQGPRGITGGLSKVLVNREPEVAVNLGPHPLSSRLDWQTSASYGHYRESPTGISDDRSALTTGLQLGPFPVGKKLSFNAASAYRLADYGNGDDSRVLYGRLTAKIKPEPDWQLELSLVGRGFRGDSPFRFDQVNFSRELAAELACPLGKNWQGRFINRYDLKRQETRDVGVALTYRAHCLDYTLGWRQNRDLFEFGVSLVPPESPAQ